MLAVRCQVLLAACGPHFYFEAFLRYLDESPSTVCRYLDTWEKHINKHAKELTK